VSDIGLELAATREMMNHLLRTESGLEAELPLDQLGDRAAGLCICCDRPKRVLVNAWYSGGDGEMDRGDGKATAVLVDDDFRFAVDLLRHEARHAKQSDERHGETGGMSRPKQLLRIGTRLFTVAAEERVGIGFQRAALGRDRALAFTQAAVPGGRSKAFHGSLLLSCCACAGFVRLAVPRLRGSAA